MLYVQALARRGRSIRPRSTRIGRDAVRRRGGEAARGRDRHRQQRRAAARLVLPLSARAPERARRQLDTADAAATSTAYPVFQKLWAQAIRRHASAFPIWWACPKAIGEVNYLDDKRDQRRMPHFKSVLDEERSTPFAEPFMCAPSPGHRRAGLQERALRYARQPISRRSAARCRSSTRRSCKHGYPAADRRARPRAGAAHHLQGPAGLGVPGLRREDHRDHQRGARQRAARPRPASCLLGQLGIAARPRRAARGHPADPAEGQRRRLRAAVRQSAARPRVQAVRAACRSPTIRVLVAGVIDSLTNFVEHPEVVADRIERVAAAVGDPIARAGRHRLRLRHVGRLGPRRRRRGVGEAQRA